MSQISRHKFWLREKLLEASVLLYCTSNASRFRSSLNMATISSTSLGKLNAAVLSHLHLFADWTALHCPNTLVLLSLLPSVPTD